MAGRKRQAAAYKDLQEIAAAVAASVVAPEARPTRRRAKRVEVLQEPAPTPQPVQEPLSLTQPVNRVHYYGVTARAAPPSHVLAHAIARINSEHTSAAERAELLRDYAMAQRARSPDTF